MMPVIPYSIGNVSILPRTITLTSSKDSRLTRCRIFGKSNKPSYPAQRFPFHQTTSVQFFHKYTSRSLLQHRKRTQVLATVETDVAVEETRSVTEGGDNDETSEASSSETSEAFPTENKGPTSNAQSRRTRPVRRSEMPPVKNEELIPGASFTGKIRSIQPFGAFVDFGAFTDGLVHVSQLSDSFVRDVNSVVSVGQEVKVRLLEANFGMGRISLTMREGDDIEKLQQRKDTSISVSSDKSRPPRTGRPNQRRDDAKKSSKFVKGQILNGTVKNITRAGAFISLPDDEEGFLPTSEESEGYGNLTGSSSLLAGQEVSVRVLRVSRGQVTLTMKKEENLEELNMKLNKGVVHVATNPFELAFRQNETIAAFLDEREKLQKSAEISKSPLKTTEQIEGPGDPTETKSSTPTVEELTSDTLKDQTPSEVDEVTNNDETVPEDKFSLKDSTVETVSLEAFATEENVASVHDNLMTDDKVEIVSPPPAETDEVKEDSRATDSSVEAVDKNSSSESELFEEVVTKEASEGEVSEEVVSIEASQEVSDEVVTTEADDNLTKDKEEEAAPKVVESEMTFSASNEDVKEESALLEKNGTQENNVSSSQGSATENVTVSPSLVKQLREETGAGMMDCKKALAETGGDLIKAQEFLRKKGLSSADKKASRVTAEGRIGSYIHDSRIGVLIEVNCETDFVSRGDIFKQLVDDLAMQVAACPQVKYLTMEDVPEEIVNKEREIEMQKEDLLQKPEQIRAKIVDGRIRKRLEEFALLEQAYIKNDKMVVKDWVKQTIATIGENIKVRRFERYNLGEGLEKKSQDFAAEVAAQTTAKPPPAIPKDQSKTEAEETLEKPAAVAVSAALVKQLREETGAGMMDCKKALTETEGNLEKAQEYLRKKGLASADKKSGRLAAEGRIGSYIHDSRIGVLIEVNCETDFVGRGENFKQLVDDLAMQVVACPQVQYVSVDNIPESIVSKEKELEMQREDLQSKPENIREKIVEGRVSKRLGELALLEQPFIKNDSLLVKDLVKQTVAAIGENIKVRRFVRFTLGEPIEGEKLAVEA